MPNRLARESSPYLLQHADNPVDWYPWGEEALARARAEDRPILLSIGYSACHWCHVMAHESFEDPAVAEVMNRRFINIKVDREERPDLDQIYQLAHQMMNERGGGWPLTVFLTPGLVPIFAGTYFPKQPRFNLPGFASLCERVDEVWRAQREDIERQAAQLGEVLRDAAREDGAELGPAHALDGTPIEAGLAALSRTFDRENGGFGSAPKFPHPLELEFCLRRHVATGDDWPLAMVTRTLDRMALGGLFDQLGGGFARYSVDARWQIPHFEKMLSDNGLLLRLYANAWTLTRNPLYQRVIEHTATWIMREMQSPQGGYFASIDADAEHEEGRFYLWHRDAIRATLADDEYAAAVLYFGLDGAPNFEGGRWHLNVERSIETVAKRQRIAVERAAELIQTASVKLLAAREQRVRPDCDRKHLTGWSALVIEAMARAGRALGREDWIDSAARAIRFIRTHLWRDGRLLACAVMSGESGDSARREIAVRAYLNAYLDDHAYLLAAVIELLQARFDPDLLAFSIQLADLLLAHFEDERGGFFFTSDDHERLLARMKTLHDGAQPSGNGVALLALGRLGHLTGEVRYLRAAQRGLEAGGPAIQRAPHAHVSHLFALEEFLHPTRTIIVRGPAPALAPWASRLAATYLPTTLVLNIPHAVAGLPAALDKPRRADVNAWVCQGVICEEPVATMAALESLVFKDGQKR